MAIKRQIEKRILIVKYLLIRCNKSWGFIDFFEFFLLKLERTNGRSIGYLGMNWPYLNVSFCLFIRTVYLILLKISHSTVMYKVQCYSLNSFVL